MCCWPFGYPKHTIIGDASPHKLAFGSLDERGCLISQAPLIFLFSCLLVFAIAFLLVRWLFKENLASKDSLIADKDSLIALLRDKASPEAPVSSIWEQDRKAINQAVQVVGFLVGNSGLRVFDKPHLNFQFKVFNGSVYEISVDRKAEGTSCSKVTN